MTSNRHPIQRRQRLALGLTARLAHEKVVQSKALAAYWPDAAVFDPLRLLDTPPPPKKPFVFATVGAAVSITVSH